MNGQKNYPTTQLTARAHNMTTQKNVETLKAKDYYGSHATGTVVLVNGQPSHFTGKTAKKDAKTFIDSITNPNKV